MKMNKINILLKFQIVKNKNPIENKNKRDISAFLSSFMICRLFIKQMSLL